MLGIEGHIAGNARSFAVITDATGTVPHTIALGGSNDGSFWSRLYPDSAPLSGELTRYVPYILDDDKRQLAVLDLEEGRIAWQGPFDGWSANVFRIGGRWYVYNDRADVVSVFDGSTGQLIAAANAASTKHGHIRQVLPSHVAGGTLWLNDLEDTAVLDAATLKPRYTRAITIKDVTAEARATLGQH